MIMAKKVGKEGSKSQKTIHLDNLSTLAFYRNIIGCATVGQTSFMFVRLACYISNTFLIFIFIQAAYFILIFLFFWDKFITRYIVLASLCFIANIFAYQFMSYASTPHYEIDERGNNVLVDAGMDLNIGPGSLAE